MARRKNELRDELDALQKEVELARTAAERARQAAVEAQARAEEAHRVASDEVIYNTCVRCGFNAIGCSRVNCSYRYTDAARRGRRVND